MNKPAIKTDKKQLKLLPENKEELSELNSPNQNDPAVNTLSQKVSVDPVRSDLIWLGRYPLIDKH